ncbi:hypothetical protein JG688_00007503 [Phytophthora aleatoria]|uniref:Uncharacterized protein n=1 Tax=Phytophthora aleatoria TaxID=2496075 RepID=A0A8J5IPC9_9STRA|nr:hypothetical protein JG688_00007503 [Phytophthora aleatoria]
MSKLRPVTVKAVKKGMEGIAIKDELVSAVNGLMVDRRHENNFAELKKHTDLHPIKRNVTRWSSIFKMVERYIRIRPEIKKVEAVEEKLQLREGPDRAEVRVLIDTLVSEYPVMAAHLKPTTFETGVVMVIPGSKHKQRGDDKENVDFAASVAKLVLAPQRATLLPVNFEMLMFLRANRGYWYVTTVQDVYQRM